MLIPTVIERNNSSERAYDIYSRLLKDRIILLNGEIDDNVSNIIVARSGAMTITEISNLGKPSILIPLPNVSQDHQTYNAKVLENVGAAKIIKNDELKKENLNEEIEKIIKNPELMHKMEEKAISKSVKNVQDKIYKEIKKVVKAK